MKRGFSLLETLIATGVLIVVIMGVTALSNSLIVGTVVSADKTIINRWASEGIELTQKIRDDALLNKSTSPEWFEPAIAENGAEYGWYKLTGPTNNKWTISKVIGNVNVLTSSQFTDDNTSEKLTSDTTTGFRLICVESVAASEITKFEDKFQCNTNADGATTLEDGVRTEPNASLCQIGPPGQPNDLYCQMTILSINRNRIQNPLTDIIIPSGSAVKIRSVIVWQDKDQFRSSSMATLITNWKGYEQ